MRLSFYIILALTALVGFTISGAMIWASVAYFGLLPTLSMYALGTIAVGVQVYATTRVR